MLSQTRQDEIVRIVNQNKSITVQELTELLNASESTIRRDIVSLDAKGFITKVFGGAISKEESQVVFEPSMKDKIHLNIYEKNEIAKFAASIIEKNDFIFLDAGSTTGCMIDYIEEKDATYVTNAILHAQKLAEKGFRVLLVGGMLKNTTESIVGGEAALNLQKYHFNKSFMGTNGVHAKHGCTTPDSNEASVKQMAIQNTEEKGCYLLVDQSKFNCTSGVKFAELSELICVATKIDEEYISKFRKTISISQC